VPRARLSARARRARENIADGAFCAPDEPEAAAGGLLRLQRTAGNAAVCRLLRDATGSGRPLEEPVRRRMERRFGVDLEAVRVHTGDVAGRAARADGARALAAGNDVVFAPGAYRPTTVGGERLLLHEIAHVAQQRLTGAPRAAPNPVGAEAEAEAEAQSGGPADGRSAPIRERAPANAPQPQHDPALEPEWRRLARASEATTREPGPDSVRAALTSAFGRLRAVLEQSVELLAESEGVGRVRRALVELDAARMTLPEMVVALGEPAVLSRAAREIERLSGALDVVERLTDPRRDLERYGRALEEVAASGSRFAAELPPGPWTSELGSLAGLGGALLRAARARSVAASAGAAPGPGAPEGGPPGD
jgi:hypothetical protein